MRLALPDEAAAATAVEAGDQQAVDTAADSLAPRQMLPFVTLRAPLP